MRTGTAAVMGFMAILALALGFVTAQEPTPALNCDDLREDVHRDCGINSGDQLAIAVAMVRGTLTIPTWTPTPTSEPPAPSATWSSTPTITSTASSTPTSTPTNTATITANPTTSTPVPTSTNTPTSTTTYTVEDLIADSTGPHEGTLCPLPGYDWEQHGRTHDGIGSQLAVWGTVQWASCGTSAPGTDYEIRNLRLYGLVGGAWRIYPDQTDPFNWCSLVQPNTYTLAGGCTRSGLGYRMPSGALAVHWGESTTSTLAGAQCHAMLYEARSTGPGVIMANTGMDWRSGNTSIGDSWFGSYRRLGSAWSTVGGSSCAPSVLRGNPPPL